MPASSAMSEIVDQRTASGVTVLPTPGAGGQLFVYEYDLPGRFAVETQAAQEK